MASNDVYPSPYIDKTGVVSAAWLNDVVAAIWGAIGTGRGGIPPITPQKVKANLAILGSDVGYTPTGAGAVASTVGKWLDGAWIDVVAGFNADPTGLTDSTTRIQAAATAVGAAGVSG